uniref:Aminotransferase-like plant mobile domain-containing protein n=1 Tax=Arundo donax TaxID=35708 RepID=A0A0A9FHK1_ARUDO
MAAAALLTKEQRTIVSDIGFSSILELSCSNVSCSLVHWLLDRFDPSTKTLKLENGFCFTINAKCVKKILGIPDGPRKIKCKGTLESLMFMRERIASIGRTPSVEELFGMINPELVEAPFARVFMLLALSSFLCPSSRGVCSSRYYPALINVCSIKDLDWCSFVLDWLATYVKKFKDSDRQRMCSTSVGCAIILVVYFEPSNICKYICIYLHNF